MTHIVKIHREFIDPIVAKFEELSSNECQSLNDLQFTLHLLFAVSALQVVFLQHDEVTDKSVENIEQCCGDLVRAFGSFLEHHLPILMAEIHAKRGATDAESQTL